MNERLVGDQAERATLGLAAAKTLSPDPPLHIAYPTAHLEQAVGAQSGTPGNTTRQGRRA